MKHVCTVCSEYRTRAFGTRVPLFVVILLQFVRQNSNALSIVKFSMRGALLCTVYPHRRAVVQSIEGLKGPICAFLEITQNSNITYIGTDLVAHPSSLKTLFLQQEQIFLTHFGH